MPALSGLALRMVEVAMEVTVIQIGVVRVDVHEPTIGSMWVEKFLIRVETFV